MTDQPEVTNRGFRIYAGLEDSYGAQVRVIESSAAVSEGGPRGPWVWISIKGGRVRENNGSAHLDIRDALRVRDALTAFLEEKGWVDA